MDEVQVTPVTKHVTTFRSICTQRLKFEIEYGLKRGTTDNCYVIQVRTLTATCCIEAFFQFKHCVSAEYYYILFLRKMIQLCWWMYQIKHSQTTLVRVTSPGYVFCSHSYENKFSSLTVSSAHSVCSGALHLTQGHSASCSHPADAKACSIHQSATSAAQQLRQH